MTGMAGVRSSLDHLLAFGRRTRQVVVLSAEKLHGGSRHGTQALLILPAPDDDEPTAEPVAGFDRNVHPLVGHELAGTEVEVLDLW